MEKVENLLREFGLTEYEVRAFITLLKLKIATAEQISETGNIPLPRVYDTLSELKKKGFVLINRTRPKKFKPISPEKALKNLIDIKRKNFEEKAKNLEDSIKSIEDVISEIEPVENVEKSWNIWSTENRYNVQTVFNEIEKKAKKEILIFAGDMSWLPERESNIRNAIKSGVKVKILMKEPGSKEIIKNLNKIKKLGAEVKLGYKSSLRGEIIDDENALIAFKSMNAKEKNYKSKYELTVFENPVMIEVLKENFNFWWNKLRV
jgi:sugar-specific transcriptional regulator TrmB